MKVVVEEESRHKHCPWFPHIESPRRVDLIITSLEKHGLEASMEVVRHSYVFEEAWRVVERIHYKGYLQYLLKLASKAPCELDPDTYIAKDTLDLALETIDLAYSTSRRIRGVDKKFLIIRPPGHHAGAGGKALGAPTQGFCLLNNAAAAVLGFRDNGYSRVAVLDFDLHHGNGTQEIFYRDDKVLHVDIHRDPRNFYPYTGFAEDLGNGRGYGYSVNIIVYPGTGDDLYTYLVDEAFNLLKLYDPEALVVSAGFDAYIADELSDLMVTEYSFYYIGSRLREVEVPTLIVLEGGYSLGLEYGVPALVYGLLGLGLNARSKTTTPKHISLTTRKEVAKHMDKVKKIWGIS